MSEDHPGAVDGTEDFSAGFLNAPSSDSLPPGATPDAKNALFLNMESKDQIRVRLAKRAGSFLTNPTAIVATTPIDGMWEFVCAGVVGELLVLCDGALYEWDNGTTYTLIPGSNIFTPGQLGYALRFKDYILITDGTASLRYDGTGVHPVGFVAPTSAPTLTVGAAPGVTGTYEGFAMWVDSVTGHLSSPSPISAPVAFANQARVWAKPAGAPPANVTHWRIAVRRVDTFEANFFITGVDQPVATLSYSEATSDTARRDVAPISDSNDVPPVFAFMEEYKGFRLGVLPSGADVWISKQFDAESQHPKDVFPVGGRGDKHEIVSIRKFGEEVAVRKPSMTYRLVGTRIPFQITGVDGSYGAVSQTSGQEVDGLWYDWDQERGPYCTDLNALWQPIADNQIKPTVNSVNKNYLHRIDSCYFSTLNLLVWAVPTNSARKRTLLAFNTLFQRWLPPITGFEYTVLTTFTTPGGQLGLYFGDEWGRIYELFRGAVDGPSTGTTASPITGATAGTITAAAAAFYTTGSGLAGMPIAVKSPAGAWQWVRAQSNTGTIITLDTLDGIPLNPIPAADGTWTVYVGAIEWYWHTPQLSGKKRHLEKLGRRILIEGSASTGSPLEVTIRYNRRNGYENAFVVTFPATGMAWGIGIWGLEFWGGGGTGAMRKRRHNRSYFLMQMRWQNYYPGQTMEIASYAVTADYLKRTVDSV